MTEAFLHFELVGELTRRKLLIAEPGSWQTVTRSIATLGSASSRTRVLNNGLTPIARFLGYAAPVRQDPVPTREGREDGGWMLCAANGGRLRAWVIATDEDLDAPTRHGRAYRLSPTRSAHRVLRAAGEPVGLLTNGSHLRLLLSEPSLADSHLEMALAYPASAAPDCVAPDPLRLLHALAAPSGLLALPALLDSARLSQTRITTALRVQARAAIEGFLQALLDQPANRTRSPTKSAAETLWSEALVLVYRLLFILKLESANDPARAFSFAATSLWREALSPNLACGALVRRHIDQKHETGRMLEDGLRGAFRLFRDGLDCSELAIPPLGGALFGPTATPCLDAMAWGERSVAVLLDHLLWTRPSAGARARIHYGSLGVEELGRIYEALLDLEPGIAERPMVRLRRGKLEAVVPLETAAAHRPVAGSATVRQPAHGTRRAGSSHEGRRDTRQELPDTAGDISGGGADAGNAATRISWVGEIAPGAFHLRPGLGRKATGAFYTPHNLVQYLMQATLAPKLQACCSEQDPQPAAVLALKVLDPATGSGHFLVAACRLLGEALYEACRACDTLASVAERDAIGAVPGEAARLSRHATLLRGRISALPDPDQTLLAYMPSRAPEGGADGVSRFRALAICRRLVAVHCLYGADSNRLAVELAKVSLWLESYAEGLPLTFLDHRLLVGDSLSGPSLSDLGTLPVGGQELDPLLAGGLAERLVAARDAALAQITALDATLGRDLADLGLKQESAIRLTASLAPLLNLARAWSGAVMRSARDSNDAWLDLAQKVAATGIWPDRLSQTQADLLETGRAALSFDLRFPDVFRDGGFDVIAGNPPWGVLQPLTKDFVAAFDPAVLDAPTKAERAAIETRVLSDPRIAAGFNRYKSGFDQQKAIAKRLFRAQSTTLDGDVTGGNLDTYRLFAERAVQLCRPDGAIGLLLPSAFHANEGSSAIRRLYLDQTRWLACLSFENRRKMFDIDSRFKFALVVARRPGPTTTIECGFYLESLDDLRQPGRLLTYDRNFLETAGGAYLTPLELRGAADLELARTLFRAPHRFDTWCRSRGFAFGCDLHMTADSAAFQRLAPVEGKTAIPADLHRAGDAAPMRSRAGAQRLLLVADQEGARGGHSSRRLLPLHEGKTFHQYTDEWVTAPRYGVARETLSPTTRQAATHDRLAFRDIARSSDERTTIAVLAPADTVFGHTANVERAPGHRSERDALLLCALMNSHVFDWLVRQKAAAHLSLFLLSSIPIPEIAASVRERLVDGAIRLTCNHVGYSALWRRVSGCDRRGRWPIVANADARWRLRAEMDALIAHAYGLDRAQYQQVLAGFNYRSWPETPALCLAAFDQPEG
jgi:hypothetical protein